MLAMYFGILSQLEGLVRAARLEEAAAMASRPEVLRHSRARSLLIEIAARLVERARVKLREDDFAGAVKDCDRAIGLVPPTPDVLRLRTVARDAMLHQQGRNKIHPMLHAAPVSPRVPGPTAQGGVGRDSDVPPPLVPFVGLSPRGVGGDVGVGAGAGVEGGAGFAHGGYAGKGAVMAENDTPPPVSSPSHEFTMHVDGSGSYRVLTAGTIRFGPIGSRAEVQLPGQSSAPVTTVIREDEEYFLGEVAGISVVDDRGGAVQPTGGRIMLRHGHRVYLASRCGFEFYRPSPVSSTAMVVPLNARPGSPKAIVLMDGEIVIGAGPQCHVRVHDAGAQLVMFRRKGQLVLRSPTGSLLNASGLGDGGEVNKGVSVAACGVGMVVADK